MKLLTKYNRVNVLATVIVLLLSGICYYFVIRYVLLDQLDDDLKIEEAEIIDHVRSYNELPGPSSYKDQKIFFEQSDTRVQRAFKSITVFSEEEKEDVISRLLIFPVEVNGKNYTATVSKSEEETEDLIRLIFSLTLIIIIVLLIVLFGINRFLLNKLWKPFNTTLKELKQFDPASNSPLRLESTNINEFADLNDTVSLMSSRVNKDYHTLKTFTENASHEMQTPLAIINSKLDVLIQDEQLSEFQVQHLQGIYDALDRLSNLNQSLLLLIRIGNNQYNEVEHVRVDSFIKERLVQLEELMQAKNLHIDTSLQETPLLINRKLLDILVSNLLINAIRYNIQDGRISIVLTPQSLTVVNDSVIPPLDREKVFQRFYRHPGTSQDGNGLGLSVVKQICDMAGYIVAYEFIAGQHRFTVSFS